MRPRRVTDLQPTMALALAAQRIVAVRLTDLYACAPGALDEGNAIALHDLRIAVKRLRYVLELVGFCLGDDVAEALSQARALQTLIGDIHDCDVLLARIAGMPSPHVKGMRRLTRRFRDRRGELFAQFTTLWRGIEAGELRASLAAATGISPDGVSTSS
jgi:CHAD domain-containing protein